MPRHPKQNEYELNASNRQALRIQAAMFGWTRIDALDSFLTADGEVIVIDKGLNRYAATAEAEKLLSPVVTETSTPLVAPADVDAASFGPRWEKGRRLIGERVASLDLVTLDRAHALTLLTELASVSLRAVELLTEHNGPDWREAIGLSTEES